MPACLPACVCVCVCVSLLQRIRWSAHHHGMHVRAVVWCVVVQVQGICSSYTYDSLYDYDSRCSEKEEPRTHTVFASQMLHGFLRVICAQA
jgi:hypothetical protein